MVLFPETVEDIDLIYADTWWDGDCLETFIEQLTYQGVQLDGYGDEFSCYSDQLSASGQEAQQYCEELALFSQALSARVEYDVHMAVLAEEYSWYSVRAAVLAEELLTHSAAMAAVGAIAARFSEDLREYSALLREYNSHDR